MALSKLRYHFPRALPQITEDVDDWLARMDGLLDMLKGAVHQGRPLDVERLMRVAVGGDRWAERFRRLRATRSPLAPLLDGVTFLEFTHRACADPAVLEWIDAHAVPLSQLLANGEISLPVPLMLCTLRGEMDAGLLTFVLDAMADTSFCSTLAGTDYHEYLMHLQRVVKSAANRGSLEIPERPSSPTVRDVWERFLEQLLAMKPKARQTATALLGSVMPADLVPKTRTMTAQDREEESKFLRILQQHRRDEFLSRWKGGKREEVKKLLTFQWPRTNHRLLDEMTFVLAHIPAAVNQKQHLGVWSRFLSFLPRDDDAMRLRLFAKWEKERVRWGYSDATRTNRQFRQVLSELSRLFSRRGVHRWLLRHWRRYLRVTDRLADRNERWDDQAMRLLTASYTAVDLLQEDDVGRTFVSQWIRLLEAMVYDRNLSLGDELLSSLGEFVRGAPDTESASQLVSALVALKDDTYCEEDIRATFAIASEDADLPAILRKVADDSELCNSVDFLGRHLHDKDLRGVVERGLLNDRKKALARLASYTRALVALGCSVPKVPKVASSGDWFDRYPRALEGPLADLCRVTTDAKAIATRLLDKEFPTQDDLLEESKIIRQQLAVAASEQNEPLQARLRKRLANLQHHMDQPHQVSPRRLANLARKVCDRVDHEILEHYIEECHAQIGVALEQRYGFRLSAERLFEPPRDALLSGILQLEEPMRELGLQLLSKSLEDPTCDFRTEPQNVAFLEHLEDQGIDTGPWLEPWFERTARASNGELYGVSFTRDVNDVLLMGSHFDTCLSPEDMNFFSAVANAVDINKQVLYGKTASGRVIGRCLFALTDGGGLLTYRRYAHDPKDGFKEQVDQFAEQLAEAMHTKLVDSGRVSKLVARRWYDDGAIPRHAIYNLHDVDGPVRSILRAEAVTRILDRLIDVLGSEEILTDLLGSLLFLEEFQSRREIIGPFLERFAFASSKRMSTRMRLAVLARLAGYDEIALNVIGSLGINSLPRRLKRLERGCCGVFDGIGTYDEVFDLLIECNPSIALRTLRLTRPRGVASDEGEENPLRKEILARCFRVLRPRS